MTVEHDLASWGEPPPTDEEQLLLGVLDVFLDSPADIAASSDTGRTLSAQVFESARGLAAGLRSLEVAAEQASTEATGWTTLPDPGLPADLETAITKLLAYQVPDERPLPDPFPGEFRLLRWLGGGAFGAVYLAEDLNLGRLVALKTLPPRSTEDVTLAALRNDARTLTQLRHRNVVQVYAWRQTGKDHYLVLQYVSGGSLEKRLEQGPVSWPLATRWVADVGEGLLAAHQAGIIHRDIKPANMLFDPDTGEALLTDFGVAAHLGRPGAGIAGTPAYMAPEAFSRSASPAQDVYGLAASLFHLVTGEVPFPHCDWDVLRQAAEQGLPEPDPRCAALPQVVERVLRQGLGPNPSQRPGLKDFVAQLRGTLNLSLADQLGGQAARPRGQAPVDLRLVVSCQAAGGVFRPVATTHPQPERFLRDMKRVPQPPDQLRVHTGDQVRVEVVADQPGFLTVFNVGPKGNLNLLYPADPRTTSAPVQPHKPLPILEVEMSPPTGRERLVAVWTRSALPLRLEEWQALAQQGRLPVSASYQATRDMLRVQQSVLQLPPSDWHVVVLELNHVPA